ncbi:MAG: DNA methyltransferase [Candidatus Binataceae bacterium]
MARPSALVDTRIIYCGDCLDRLRKLPDACIDLIYIDPPFNSNRNYEVFWGETKEKRAFEDRHASTQAYIEFMRPRCVELARVLRPTDSFYYHCDWHASHYVKVMLDQIIGENNFQNDIAWKRTTAHTDSTTKFGHVTDTLLFYTGGDKHTWNPQYREHKESYIKSHYSRQDNSGRHYRLDNIIRSQSMGPRPNLVYAYKGFTPEWGWRVVRDKLETLDSAALLQWSKSGTPYLVRYLDEQEGELVDNIWDDIPPVNSQAKERLGYPTQKPLALLERIMKASSKPNDIVLDAFCGCGTALIAAQKLKRQWIGIDISPTACRVMAKRLRDVCTLREDVALWSAGRGFVVRDLPWTEAHLRKLPPFEFENWAVIALGGIPNKAKVGDMGIDGRIYPVSAVEHRRDTTQRRERDAGARELGFMDQWYPIQVKQKDKVGRPDIDSFEAVMAREERSKGFFVSFDYTSDALTEIDRFFRTSGKVIVPFTVREIIDEEIARKLS